MIEGDWQVLTGQSSAVLESVIHGQSLLLHREVLPHWYELVERASAAGFDLQIASAWRGFERQQMIWNGKATGQRPVLNECNIAIDVSRLSDKDRLFAILRWSAIPGCSRHHWGTDMDVFDASAAPKDYRVQLIPEECTAAGPFAALHVWLDETLQEKNAVFFRPYAVDRGGIAAERWHLSCRPVAARYEFLLEETRLIEWILTQDIVLKECIRMHWHEIFHRFILANHDGDA